MDDKFEILAESSIQWTASNGKTLKVGYELVEHKISMLGPDHFVRAPHGLSLTLRNIVSEYAAGKISPMQAPSVMDRSLAGYRSLFGRYQVIDPHDINYGEERRNRYSNLRAALIHTLLMDGRVDVLDRDTQDVWDGCQTGDDYVKIINDLEAA